MLMRVIFIGATQFGQKCLQELNKLSNISIDLVGVVTAPQFFSISYRPQGVENVLHADVGDFCKSLNIFFSVFFLDE
jgi:methionyl-tRNA formyltransferase